MTNGINTRELILQILLEIEEEGKHSHIAIRNALSKYQFLPRQERAFITRVCEGTLEYRILIDYIIDSNGEPYFIEFNVCCNLGKHAAINMAAQNIGITYSELINNILYSSLYRQDLIDSFLGQKL